MSHTPSAPYLDAAESVEARVDDLLPRVTIAEKVGQLFHTRKGKVSPRFLALPKSDVGDADRGLG
ncbi:MAG: hypothetical protein EX269_11300 [Acidimicrobiales bacterium]|nr:MAG: hypothetical protein EX269_11300 [Acidimicrobiales bacterium]